MIENIDYKIFGNSIQISNEKAELIITADVGPRIISFKLKDRENMMFEDIDKNFVIEKEEADLIRNTFGSEDLFDIYGGHRLWHSPEAMPRTYYPDNLKVSYEIKDDKIILKSEIEKINNIQKQMIVSMEDNRVVIDHKITNTGLWEIEMAVWALSVMGAGGLEVIPQPNTKTGLLANRNLSVWEFTKMNDERVYFGDKFITLEQKPLENPFKIGINNTLGYAAYFNNDCLFIKYHEHNDDGIYPDFGVSYETYTSKLFLEMETLSELKKVKPGEAIEHREVWELYGGVKRPQNKDEDTIAEILDKYLKKGETH